MELTLRKNIKNIYAMMFFQSFMIIIAVFVPLLQRHGLSMSSFCRPRPCLLSWWHFVKCPADTWRICGAEKILLLSARA